MADVTLRGSGANNGTLTPATPGSQTTAAGNLLVLIIAVLGTSPTLTTPASWTQVQKTSGASLSFAMYILPNNPGGATNPSSTLGGTITGWVAAMFEFTATGANCALQNSNMLTSAVAQLTNIFANVPSGQMNPNSLFVYAVARATATITTQNAGLTPPYGSSLWSASVQPQAGVQGMSMDFYWASNLGMIPAGFPTASGLLSGAVASVAIGAYFNTLATQPTNGTPAGGAEGIYQGSFAGMIGG